jgi:fumarylacetoacetase
MPEALTDSQTITSSDRAKQVHSSLANHLKQSLEKSTWDIDLEVSVVRRGTSSPMSLCRSNLRHGYWSPAQMIAHHSSSGCGLDTGDLIGTGTLSGPDHSDESPSLGCLHELNKSGTLPIRLRSSQEQDEMMWLNDGDEVIFSGWTGREHEKKQRIGFGDLTGVILGAL